MHWGHAISTDLVDWKHLPIALYPDSLGYIFSGSAVIDWKNTSGFGSADQPPMVAIFTHHDMAGERAGREDNQSQSIAYSTDRGRSWTKYSGNPVIPNPVPNVRNFRDPKVIWDPGSEQWVMVFAAEDHVKFYGSPDLKSWTHLSDWGREYGTHAGVWECPDLFPLKVAGTDEQKWILLQSLSRGGANGGSAIQYFVGDFDGKNFIVDESFAPDVAGGAAVWLDYGRDNYAGVTWSDIPREDGRRIFLGWMSNIDYAQVVPTTTWRSAMTLPRTLTLHRTDRGLRLRSEPVRELTRLRGTARPVPRTQFQDQWPLIGPTDTFPLAVSEIDLRFDLTNSSADSIVLHLANAKNETLLIGYDRTRDAFFTDRRAAGLTRFSDKFAASRDYAPRASENAELRMHLFLDRSSLELFTDDGEVVLSDLCFPTAPFNRLWMESGERSVQLIGGTIWPLAE
jgi:fructan beta-fructosidase